MTPTGPSFRDLSLSDSLSIDDMLPLPMDATEEEEEEEMEQEEERGSVDNSSKADNASQRNTPKRARQTRSDEDEEDKGAEDTPPTEPVLSLPSLPVLSMSTTTPTTTTPTMVIPAIGITRASEDAQPMAVDTEKHIAQSTEPVVNMRSTSSPTPQWVLEQMDMQDSMLGGHEPTQARERFEPARMSLSPLDVSLLPSSFPEPAPLSISSDLTTNPTAMMQDDSGGALLSLSPSPLLDLPPIPIGDTNQASVPLADPGAMPSLTLLGSSPTTASSKSVSPPLDIASLSTAASTTSCSSLSMVDAVSMPFPTFTPSSFVTQFALEAQAEVPQAPSLSDPSPQSAQSPSQQGTVLPLSVASFSPPAAASAPRHEQEVQQGIAGEKETQQQETAADGMQQQEQAEKMQTSEQGSAPPNELLPEQQEEMPDVVPQPPPAQVTVPPKLQTSNALPTDTQLVLPREETKRYGHACVCVWMHRVLPFIMKGRVHTVIAIISQLWLASEDVLPRDLFDLSTLV